MASFSGDYKISYIDHTAGAFGDIFGADPPVVTLTTVSGSTTLREFKWVYLPDSYAFGGQTWRMDFVCTEVQLTDHGYWSWLWWWKYYHRSGRYVLPVDITDDSEFIWSVIEYDSDGGCGVEPKSIDHQVYQAVTMTFLSESDSD